ncbi:unnamed protein product [Ceratitis capitata]|uniref:(Mediterranean fruit fly) hypothetical protein n=1 Tax=Ceratitis capitata TaxID=7213 RepID=A0A811V5N3_CERCA|nr:unnamed protein product [Ceratitis capitata]
MAKHNLWLLHATTPVGSYQFSSKLVSRLALERLEYVAETRSARKLKESKRGRLAAVLKCNTGEYMIAGRAKRQRTCAVAFRQNPRIQQPRSAVEALKRAPRIICKWLRQLVARSTAAALIVLSKCM